MRRYVDKSCGKVTSQFSFKTKTCFNLFEILLKQAVVTSGSLLSCYYNTNIPEQQVGSQ